MPQVLERHCDASKAAHIIDDLDSFITEDMRRLLDKLTPPASADSEEKYHQYEAMGHAIRQTEGSIMNVTPCRCHKGDVDVAGAPLECMDGLDCESYSGRPIKIWVAGSVCKDFSRRGNKAKTAGVFMRPYKVWTSLVLHCRPDVVIHEITIDPGARDMLEHDLGSAYDI